VWLQKKNVLQQKKEKKKPTMEGGGERETSFMWRKNTAVVGVVSR